LFLTTAAVSYFLFVLFHIYPPVTRKRRWHNISDESAPA